MTTHSGRHRFIARWGLPLVALLLGLTLIGSSVRAFVAAHELGMTLVRGQAESFLRAVRARSQPDRPPDPGTLQAVLQEQAENGLRYVAVVEHERVVSSAGTPAAAADLALPPPGTLQPLGSTMRVVAPPPGPGGLGPPPEPAFHPFGPAPPPPVFLVLEFEPVFAQRSLRDATANVVLGVVAALVMLGAAAIFWRMTLRAERADAELARQQHLASLGQMSAVLAHELRNPLAAAKGHAQLLAEQLPEDGKPRRSAERVVDSLLRLEQLTTSLLEFARTGELAIERVSPAQLLREAAKQVGEDRIALHTQDAPETWAMDPARMRQVLVNVLDNALQASTADLEPRAEVTTRDGQLVLRVLDSGKGVEPAEAARAFEPFHTTRVRGTGLGLAIARRIVQLHGGSIALANRPEGGAIVEITLPPA